MDLPCDHQQRDLSSEPGIQRHPASAPLSALLSGSLACRMKPFPALNMPSNQDLPIVRFIHAQL
jgi:hypothetical protein